MVKLLVRTKIALLLILVVILSLSCSLPFLNKAATPPPIEIVPQIPETPPPTSSTQTPEPPLQVEEASTFDPVVGSILRWVDFSDFVFIPYGEFIMGHNSELPEDFNPEHKVTLSGFWIHQAEVTNQQYAACVAAGKCSKPSMEKDEPYRYGRAQYANYPVVGVNWYQAVEYCEWIDARLPSEAEWEKAARGVEGMPFPWGDDEPACDLLNFNNCLDPSEPADVRSYNNGTSPFEAMDMSGNVYEWVGDWYQEDYYLTSPPENPTGPIEGEKKVFRGGGYKTIPEEILPWLRSSIEPEKHSEQLGFRCVLVGEVPGENIPPPPCTVNPLGDPDTTTGKITPFTPCSVDVSASCTWQGAIQASNIHFSIGDCFDNLLWISGNGELLSCSVSGENPKNYNCNPPPGSAQGSTISLEYCYDVPLSQIALICPAGYEYDPVSSFCIPQGAWLPDPPCPVGYLELGGICLPEASTHGGCPAGFFTIYFGKTSVCVPSDPCLLPDAPESCTSPVCPEGEVYDPDNTCCVVPEKPRAVCPIGFVFDEIEGICLPGNLPRGECFNSEVKLPFCPTLTPTPTEPPPLNYCPYTNDPVLCNTRYGNWCYWDGSIGACLVR